MQGKPGKLKAVWPPQESRNKSPPPDSALAALAAKMATAFCGGYREEVLRLAASVDDLSSVDQAFIKRCVERSYLCGGGTEEDWCNCAAFLLSKRCSPNAGTNPTPLGVAARQGSIRFVRLLLASGANVENAGFADGMTPLHLAVRNSSLWEGVVQLLVQGKANVNAADGDGETPLMIAAAKQNPRTLLYLLKHGADTRAVGRCVTDFRLIVGTAWDRAEKYPRSRAVLAAWDALVWVRMGWRHDKGCAFSGMPRDVLYIICNLTIQLCAEAE